MSRSKRPQPKPDRWAGGWILETNREQRRRMKQEVDKVLKNPELVLQLSNRRESAFDWP